MLVWEDDPNFSTIFMHSRITAYTLGFPEHLVALSVATDHFPKIGQYMPDLSKLDIISVEPIVEAQTLELLTALPKLQEITLPQFHFTTKVATCLSTHPNLTRICFETWERIMRGYPEDTRIFTPSLKEGSFSALRELSFVASFQDALGFLQALSAPSQLRTLRIKSQERETRAAFKTIVSWVATQCTNIQILALGDLFYANQTIPYDPAARVNIDTIRPLFRIPLTSLTLDHQYPLNLSYADLEEISKAWPVIETLILNPSPGHFTTSELTVNALIPFARNSKCLSELGLFMDVTDQDSLLSSECPPFQHLRTLDVGLSAIDDVQAVAKFLSYVLPSENRQCIWSEVGWESSAIFTADEKIKRTALARMTAWDKVHWYLYRLSMDLLT